MSKLDLANLSPQQLALLLRYENSAAPQFNATRAKVLELAANILDAMHPDETHGLVHPREIFYTASGVNQTLLAYLRQDPKEGYVRAVAFYHDYMSPKGAFPHQAALSYVKALAAAHNIEIRKD